MRSCITTAIQLGYQTGNRYVANAAIEACKLYAPVQSTRAATRRRCHSAVPLRPTVTTDDNEQRRPVLRKDARAEAADAASGNRIPSCARVSI